MLVLFKLIYVFIRTTQSCSSMCEHLRFSLLHMFVDVWNYFY